MDCRQAQQLFDAYLDGELSPTLETELGAHRVQCGDCRRALALLEVSGHIIRADHEEAATDSAFTDRLLACMDEPSRTLTHRAWRIASIGGGLAAAAVVALAFLGLFDSRQRGMVAGERVEGPARRPTSTMSASPLPVATFEELLDETPAATAVQPNALQDMATKPDAGKQHPVPRADLIDKVLEIAAEKGLGALEKDANRLPPSGPDAAPDDEDEASSETEGDSTPDEAVAPEAP